MDIDKLKEFELNLKTLGNNSKMWIVKTGDCYT